MLPLQSAIAKLMQLLRNPDLQGGVGAGGRGDVWFSGLKQTFRDTFLLMRLFIEHFWKFNYFPFIFSLLLTSIPKTDERTYFIF